MTIDPTVESLVSLSEAARLLPGSVHVATAWRYALKGVRGNRLETIVSGGRRLTSREAILRFVERSTAAAAGNVPESPVPVLTATRRRQIAVAEAACDAAGIR